MSSFLHSLYKSRRQTTHHQEDFLSTALAGLLRRDRTALCLLLDELGIDLPDDLARRAITSQYVLRGTAKRPDLHLALGRGESAKRILLECKLGDHPAHNNKRGARQIAAYQALFQKGDQPLGPVALLCTRAQLRDIKDDADFAHVQHRASWEGFCEALQRDNRRLDDSAVPHLRRDFLALAHEFEVGGYCPIDAQCVAGSHTGHHRS